MNYEEYIEDISKLIEANINRTNSKNSFKNPFYSCNYRNYFELSSEEYKKLNNIVDNIYVKGEFKHKIPKNFIFDKLVKEVIINSYDLNSTRDIIKLNLKNNFDNFDEILTKELKDWTYFIPISGLIVEKDLNFESMTICTFKSFKNEILDYYKRNPILSKKYENRYEQRIKEIDTLNQLCFVKLTVNGTKEVSKDKALNRVNELLSIFSLYKTVDINGFGIMGEVLPLNSKIITYFINKDNLNISRRTSVRNIFFNLTKNLDNMKKYHLEYLINLIHKDDLNYVEKMLLNSIHWYYESVKREFNLKEDVVNETLDSNEYYEHYTYFKLGTKIINLVSSLESLLLLKNSIPTETKKCRFNKIMNYNETEYDFFDDLDELYKYRNDIVHSNKDYNLLKFNIDKYTTLIRIFIFKFIEIKVDFDNNSEKSLNTKEDLIRFYERLCKECLKNN